MATNSKKKSTNKKVEETVEIVETQEEVIEEVVAIAEEVVTPIKEVATPKVEVRTYADDDLIVCRSITHGELILIGKKSHNRYVWSNYDDTCEVEVRDLNASRAAKSIYLFDPLFVIEDEDFIAQPKWKEIKSMYDKTMSSDISTILEKPLREFKGLLAKLPKGYQKALCDEVATRIHNDEFDSMQKIKAIDEICGTDLYLLIK